MRSYTNLRGAFRATGASLPFLSRRAHYPRYSIIRGKLQMSFGILGFEQKISDNVFHVWYS